MNTVAKSAERDCVKDGEWRCIPGYGGMYQINWDGEVRTWRWRKDKIAQKPRILNQFMARRGRTGRARFVKLIDSNGKAQDVKVLRLMAEVWLGGIPEGKVPYHKNGDLADHCVNNVGFATRQELGKMFGAKASRIPVAKVTPDGEIVEVYPSARAAAKANYMSYQSVIDRCNGKVKNPYALDGHNYIWEDGKNVV